MQIRTRLALQFLLLGGIIMIIASVAIYFSSARLRKGDFYKLLWNDAGNTANLLFNTSQVEADRVLGIEKNSPLKLQNEKIIIINFNNDIVYSSDENKEIEIRNYVLDRVRLGNIVTYKQSPFEVIGTLFYTTYDRFVVLAAGTDIEGSLRLKNL